jgi:hypothetical protein
MQHRERVPQLQVFAPWAKMYRDMQVLLQR